jgi:signal transduction histidine kinase
LLDEYLRLSYHGLRAKDKSFSANFETNLDSNLPRIKVTSRDIGRVFLNIFNNAFYSVGVKRSYSHDYTAMVTVSTKLLGDMAEIRIRDNGLGIPGKALDKIFQPFFTTKPTGQGTGLGLSLSYDIIKAHNGLLFVETVEGEFAEFIIHLPLNPTG